MSDFDEEVEAFLAERQEAASTDAPADASADRKAHLRSLIAKGGVYGQLASEALVALEEREAKAKRDELAAEAEALAEREGVDFSDPHVQAVFRAEAEQMREDALAKVRVLRRKELAQLGTNAEGVEQALAAEESANSWFFLRDALYEHPAYVRAEIAAAEAERVPLHSGLGGLDAVADEAAIEIEQILRAHQS